MLISPSSRRVLDSLGHLDDRYDLVRGERLGSGGMAEVVLSIRRSDGAKFAAKKLHKNHRSSTVLPRFLVEAEILTLCRGPGVPEVEAFGLLGGSPTIVLELCGVTLAQVASSYLRSQRIPVEAAVGYVLDVLVALGRIHRLGVIHRDVKPSNILVGPDGRARLCDFGIARSPEHRHTLDGANVGTPSYAEPLALANQSLLDPSCDLYSLGLSLAAVTTPELSPRTLMDREARRICLLRVDPSIREVVDRATSPDRVARYPTAESMAEDLAGIRRVLPEAPLRGWPVFLETDCR